MLTRENWEYIVNHWGESDEGILNEIARMKDADSLDNESKLTEIEGLKAKIDDLTRQNVDVNKTNMQLILRLTDPSLPPPKQKDEYEAPAVTDLDAFVK